MRPFAVLALNVIVGSVGFWVGGFAGGCLIVVAEGRAWAREDAADDRLQKLVELSSADDGLDWDALARINTEGWGREGRAG